ncbi:MULTISPECIES: rhodanese-like domain-containing protein [unclassified Herbaspirillum]|uniref:rhodanese-like domain-containing protein n=1 Tax=unclassified Herbaspirillum TaxID=2624150 RepID=UPI00115293A3|nr:MULTISPECIES: rhodanese-like domain-containing protein [unclassified Herbaspirillum]MBB5393682.1 rhodanese-related sulfurtransferase [Herbaspirillum sp. SJZ102]TQK01456.1 rhodanese-related sulfurtransferase [Herbaspirillum sp. SJZ130]TQK05852.1 rhodanese-related sulfurtransferase [Herbaspirillum sp. SJZ106]
MKFIIDNIFLIALALVSGGALLVPYLQQRGNKLTLLQATQMINQGKTLVLDVRDADQFAAGHLRDARNIPLKELPQRIAELDKFKGRQVIVVCQNGTQAMKAEASLKKAGFADVYGLNGGIAAWAGQGLPLTTKDAK